MNSVLFLDNQQDIMLYPTSPFNFDGTVHKPDYFPSSDNAYEEGRYWQTMYFRGIAYGTKFTNEGTTDNPAIRLSVFSEKPVGQELLHDIGDEVAYRFDLNADLTEFYTSFSNDTLLGPVIARWKGMRVSTNVSLYEFLVIATLLQNTVVRRSVQMMENLFQKYGSKVCFDSHNMSVFWDPKIIHEENEDALRMIKLGYRAKTLKRQAEIFVFGKMDEMELRHLDEASLKGRLLELYGIGPASVWYLLFQVFKHYDAFEYISPWELKIFSKLMFDQEMVDAQFMIQEANNRWGKWRMLALHYLFEDIFWLRKNEQIPWLEALIRL